MSAFADEELIKTKSSRARRLRLSFGGRIVLSIRWKMKPERASSPDTRCSPEFELLYDDIHMSCGVAHREDPRADLLEINHCRTGRFECEFSDGRAVYLGEGDWQSMS